MGKGARLRRERAEGTRVKINRWGQIPPGHRMVIPTFDKVKLGAMPVVIPSPGKHKGSAAETVTEDDIRNSNEAFAESITDIEQEIEEVQGIAVGEHDAENERGAEDDE